MKKTTFHLILLNLILCFMSSCNKNEPSEIVTPRGFSISVVSAQEQIENQQSVEIRLDINRSQSYNGIYFMRYYQSDKNGWGELSYNGARIASGATTELAEDKLTLIYRAISHNYHKLEFTIHDSYGNIEEVSVVFNADKLGNKDPYFTVTPTTLPTDIAQKQTVSIILEIDQIKPYIGNYFIKYNQFKGHGFGELEYSGVPMEKAIRYTVVGNRIVLQYKALSANYHRLDIEIFDEFGNTADCVVALNEDKIDTPDHAFSVTCVYEPIFTTNYKTIHCTLKQLDLDYSGKYFIRQYQLGSVGTIHLLGKYLEHNKVYELDLRSDGTFELSFRPNGIKVKADIHLVFTDELGNIVEEVITFLPK